MSGSSLHSRRSLDVVPIMGSQLGCGSRYRCGSDEFILLRRRKIRQQMEEEEQKEELQVFLPDEILVLICRYADFPTNFSVVCSRWNRIYRSCFCYVDPSLGWIEGYRWCINFARQQVRRRDRERMLSALVRRVLDGLSMLVFSYGRLVRTLFERGQVAQGVFLIACGEGFTKMARVLLEEDERIDPAEDSNAALIEAACRGHEEVVRLLLEDPRVDISALANCGRTTDLHRWTFVRELLNETKPLR